MPDLLFEWAWLDVLLNFCNSSSDSLGYKGKARLIPLSKNIWFGQNNFYMKILAIEKIFNFVILIFFFIWSR